MEIKILHLINGAKQAKGLAVIIDVFRAFSTACYVFGNGAKKIIPIGDIETEGVLNWANMANYYYETDLVYYFDNANGEMIIPSNSFIGFYPQYVVDPRIDDTEDYILTTEVIALN